MATASLVLGALSIPTFGCLIVGAVAGIVLGSVALTRANRDPQEYGGRRIAIAGIAASAFALLVALPMGIIAAIAIPNVFRARASASEAATLGDVRTVVAAEAAYAAETGGSYGPLKCLRTPTLCLPEYSGPGFIDAELAYETEKYGYRRTFHPGPEVPVTDTPPGAPFAAERLDGYAFTAVPTDHGRAGTRAICGDASGRVCAAPSRQIDASSGACPPPPECADL